MFGPGSQGVALGWRVPAPLARDRRQPGPLSLANDLFNLGAAVYPARVMTSPRITVAGIAVARLALAGSLLMAPVARPASPDAARSRALPGRAPHLADYDSELRLSNGRVDVDALVARLKELHVATYYWLIWHAATDWEDLKLFLPKAASAGLDVWVYLVPPSESPPHTSLASEPFGTDYGRWAKAIAELSVQQTNLTAWVIDDFYANHRLFTPALVSELQRSAHRINPRLAFLPLMYFSEITRRFAEDYHGVIDGVVVAYPQDREEIDTAWAVLNDVASGTTGELSCPWDTPSHAGDFVSACVAAKVQPAPRCVVHFRDQDDFTGPTAGYHFRQLLVGDTVVWEEDVAGGQPGWQEHAVDVTPQLQGKDETLLTFRLLDKQGVSNFGVRWRLRGLQAEGLLLAATLTEPSRWRVQRQGPLEAGFGETPDRGIGRFHVPFVVMTAAQASEFRLRHGEPASPDRIVQWLRLCLEARRDGKCDGVVTYCLDKAPQSSTFPRVRDLFAEFAR